MLNLNPQSMFVGQSVIFVKELASTNDYLKHFAKNDGLAEGAVVVTEFQTKGKGQHANSWHSEANQNALFSVLLRPKNLQGDHLNALSFLVSLAVRATVQKYLPSQEVTVKWPNDVMVGNKKVAGILIENRLGNPTESIVGVGLNVNQRHFDTLPNAVSMNSISGSVFTIEEVISECLGFVEKYYLLSKRDGGVKQLQTLYVSQLYKLNEEVLVNSKKYKITGVDMEGKLLLENENGPFSIYHKEAIVEWN